DASFDDRALVYLGRLLRERGYRFTPVSPTSHARHVRARGPMAMAHTLRDVFGWCLPFSRDGAFADIAEALDAAGALRIVGTARAGTRQLVRSGVRFASIDEQVFIHGGYPPDPVDAVVVGPEHTRFCRLLQQRVVGWCGRVLDLGAGCGMAGLLLGKQAQEVLIADDNREALRLARVNAAVARIGVDLIDGDDLDVLDDIGGPFDLIVVGPQSHAERRHYRAGWFGGLPGVDVAARTVAAALPRLKPEGRLLMAVRTPIVDGRDLFFEKVKPLLEGHDTHYDEIDTDVVDDDDDGLAVGVERVAATVLDVHI
ncbi:MAG TPA: methyltransferase, partial [Myxococcota bacterium]